MRVRANYSAKLRDKGQIPAEAEAKAGTEAEAEAGTEAEAQAKAEAGT